MEMLLIGIVVLFIAFFTFFYLIPTGFVLYNQKNYKQKIREKEEAYHEHRLDLARKRQKEFGEVFDNIEKTKEKFYKAIEKEAEERRISLFKQIKNEEELKREKIEVELNQQKQEMLHNLENFRQATAEESEEIKKQLNALKSKEESARLARLREYEENNKENFYMINIPSSDIYEIEELEKIVPKLTNARPLRKAIFDIYYKEHVKDMINRITEGKRISGIYKITEPKTGMCYIGQSVDIGNRWMQHCKRGVGVNEKTTIKLYSAMEEEGIYNFKFEIIEKDIEKDDLSEREKFWGDYFGSKVFGYSVKN